MSEIKNSGSVLETTVYSYDANGSLISENDGDVTTYAYDVWGNMVSAGNASYAYNAQGLRVSKTVNGATNNFILVGGDVWADSESTYLRGLELISSSDYFYLYNIRGDVIQLLNYSGEVVKTYDYDAYGNELTRDLSDENPFRYCGEYYDTETGLVYLRARYYDPSIGRFTSVDPAKDGLNWYSYCDNNPVMRIDPKGEAWYHWAIGAAIVVACAAAVVLTAGGALAAVTAVGMVTSGAVATTTATTVASYAFIGSAFAFGGCVLSAGFSAKTPQEFADEGNWGTVLSTAGGAAVGGAFGYLVDRVSRSKGINIAGKGSTGRTEPQNKNEKSAMKLVLQNPLQDATHISKIKMSDSRWSASDGWIKMQRVVKHSDGMKSVIHFVYNEALGLYDDFKFVYYGVSKK